MTEPYTIIQGAELPDLTITWRDQNDAIINFATGYTFTLKLGQPGQAATLTKTTGITGSANSPNITVTWAGDLDMLPPALYTLQLTARRTADGKDRILTVPFKIRPAIT